MTVIKNTLNPLGDRGSVYRRRGLYTFERMVWYLTNSSRPIIGINENPDDDVVFYFRRLISTSQVSYFVIQGMVLSEDGDLEIREVKNYPSKSRFYTLEASMTNDTSIDYAVSALLNLNAKLCKNTITNMLINNWLEVSPARNLTTRSVQLRSSYVYGIKDGVVYRNNWNVITKVGISVEEFIKYMIEDITTIGDDGFFSYNHTNSIVEY